jgi:DNA-binding transcriptional regulator YiaG
MKPLEDLLQQLEARANLPDPDTLKRLRRAGRLSAEQVGKALGVSRQAVLNWEAGRSSPSPDHVIGYARLIRALQESSKPFHHSS